MPARCGHKHDLAMMRRAAEMVLSDELDSAQAVERFGVSRGALWKAVQRLREERRAEDRR